MESRDDKLIAIIGLLSACLIGVVFLFTMTWLTGAIQPIRHWMYKPARPKPPARCSTLNPGCAI